MIVIAHPDDETFTGGLICELVSLGCEVEVVCLTRGEGGPTGQWTRGELGVVRTGEMEKACNVLGVKTLTFLDHIDPVGGQYRVFAPDVSTKALVRQILPLIEGADLVVSHGSCGEYWHSAHLLVYSAVKASLAQCQESVPGWMTFMARQPGHRMKRLINWDDEADVEIDVSSHASKRLEALKCHQSQSGLFCRFAEGTQEDYIEKTSIETLALRRPVA